MTMQRRDFFKLSALAGVSFLIPGCKPLHHFTGQDSSNLHGEDRIIRASLANPACIEPYNPFDAASMEVCSLLFEPLLRYDYQQGLLIAGAAQSWEVSSDGLVYTFHLRDGATFFDDEPVTAQTFKNAWERLVHPNTNKSNPTKLRALLQHVQGYADVVSGQSDELLGAQVYGDYHLDVVLEEPFPEFPYVVTHPALSPVPALASDAEFFASNPVGNGPYELENEWVDGQQITLKRNDTYVGDTALLDKVEFKVFRDEDTAYLEFLAGNIDVASIPISRYAQDAQGLVWAGDGHTLSARAPLINGTLQAVSYLICNMASMALQPLDVRRAISLSIDRDALCTQGFAGIYTSATSLMPPGLLQGSVWRYCRYDAKMAAELFTKAQTPEGSAAANPLSLRMCYGDDAESVVAATAIISALSSLGILVSSEQYSWEEYESVLEKGDFDLALYSWLADVPVCGAMFDPLYEENSPYNFGHAGDTKMWDLMQQARVEIDEEARKKLYVKVDEYAQEQLQLVPLYYPRLHETCNASVAELYYDLTGQRHFESADTTRTPSEGD